MKRKIYEAVQYDYKAEDLELNFDEVNNHKKEMSRQGFVVKDEYWVNGTDEAIYTILYHRDLLSVASFN